MTLSEYEYNSTPLEVKNSQKENVARFLICLQPNLTICRSKKGNAIMAAASVPATKPPANPARPKPRKTATTWTRMRETSPMKRPVAVIPILPRPEIPLYTAPLKIDMINANKSQLNTPALSRSTKKLRTAISATTVTVTNKDVSKRNTLK